MNEDIVVSESVWTTGGVCYVAKWKSRPYGSEGYGDTSNEARENLIQGDKETNSCK